MIGEPVTGVTVTTGTVWVAAGSVMVTGRPDEGVTVTTLTWLADTVSVLAGRVIVKGAPDDGVTVMTLRPGVLPCPADGEGTSVTVTTVD